MPHDPLAARLRHRPLLGVPLAARADLSGPRVPPGTHTDAQGQLVSDRGLRGTSDFLAAELALRGIAAQQIGPYGVRGVELTRSAARRPRPLAGRSTSSARRARP